MAIETIEVVIPVNTGTSPPAEYTVQAMNYANQALSYKNLAYASEQAAALSALAASNSAEALLNLDNFKPKGVLDCSTNPNYPNGIEGDYYIVSVAGKIGGSSGIDVFAGDIILCTTPANSGNQATVGSSWIHIVTNLDGMVVGPSVSTVDNIATYNSTNGKLIKDSGVSLSSLARTADLGDLATIDNPVDTTKILSGAGWIAKPSPGIAISDVLPYIIALS